MRPQLSFQYLLSQGLSETAPVRFFKHVIKTETCWLWDGAKDREGYGQLTSGLPERKRLISAHRVSWILHFGPIPNGYDVLHNCPEKDQRNCVNPYHLWVGTQAENNADSRAKGSWARLFGTKNHQAKLSEDQVKEIRRSYDCEEHTQHELAKLFGVAQRTVCKIVHNISYPDPDYFT